MTVEEDETEEGWGVKRNEGRDGDEGRYIYHRSDLAIQTGRFVLHDLSRFLSLLGEVWPDAPGLDALAAWLARRAR